MVPRLALTLPREALQKRTVHAVEGHPVKMPAHRRGVAGREQVRGRARGQGEPRDGEELGGVVGGRVGPEISVGAAAAGEGGVAPVQPAVVP